MSKIGLISQDLVDKLKTVTEFQSRVGLAVGGTEIDPMNRDLPRPASWPVFTGIQIVDSSAPAPENVSVQYTYVVKILTDYDTEANLISVHLPLLEKTIETVKGTNINGLGFHSWSYNGMSMESLDADRMVFVLNFSVLSGL